MFIDGGSDIGTSTSALPLEGDAVVGTAFSVKGAVVVGFIVGVGDLEVVSFSESGDPFELRLLDGREELPFPVVLDDDWLSFSFDRLFFAEGGVCFFFRRFDFVCFELFLPDLPFDDDDLEFESLSELPFDDDDKRDFALLPPFPLSVLFDDEFELPPFPV